MAKKFSASNQTYSGGTPDRTSTQWPYSMSQTGIRPMRRIYQMRMRDRSRQLDRNNALASGMLDRAVENIIGKGMTLRARTKSETFNKAAEELWAKDCDSIDVRGLASFGQLQRLLLRSKLRDGDVGAILVSRNGEPAIQAVEGDWIDSFTKAGLDTPNTVHGIDIDEYQRPTGFHVRYYDDVGGRQEQVIPARNFVYMPRLKTFADLRGEPVFAQVFPYFDQIDGYIEATVVAARMAACFGAVVTSSNAGNQINALGTQQSPTGGTQRIASLEPGMIQYLRPNESLTQVSPQQPTQNFPDFIAALVRFAGLNLGLPLELVMLDFSRTNYSSARAALLQAYRAFRTQQQEFIDQFLGRVYPWWISKMVKLGRLEVPAEIRDSFWDHEWMAPGWAWVDPVKEIQAAMMEVDAGLNTRTNIAASHGREFTKIVSQLAQEEKELNFAGVEVMRSSNTRDPGVPVPDSSGIPSNARPVNGEDDTPPADENDD